MHENESKAFCAAATICADGSRCAEALSVVETAGLVAMTMLPIVLSIVLPRFDSLATHERPLLGCSRVCAVPAACASTGNIVILFVMVMAILPTYFMLALSSAPCTTAIGACATISCAAGSVYFEGYVFMFTTLMLASIILVREFGTMPDATRSQRQTRAALVLGSIAMTLTGIFPEHFSRGAPGTDNWYFGALTLHATGLLFTTLALVALPFRVFVRASRKLQLDGARLVGLRAAHLAVVVVYVCLLCAYRSLPDASDFCSAHRSADACAAWANLTSTDCERLASLAPAWPRAFVVPTGHAAPTMYACGWAAGPLLTEEQRLLLPPSEVEAHDASCRKQRCAIFDNARSIGLEFGCLYLIAAYGLTYALRDVRWAMMLTRSSAPLESTGSVGGAPPFAEPSSSSHDDTDGDGAGDVVKLIRPPPATPSSAR